MGAREGGEPLPELRVRMGGGIAGLSVPTALTWGDESEGTRLAEIRPNGQQCVGAALWIALSGAGVVALGPTAGTYLASASAIVFAIAAE